MGFLYWDPSPEIFVIPGVNIPLTWYGVIFALGFFLGFQIFVHLSKNKLSKVAAESLMVYAMVGTVIGARLGHLLFYEKWSFFLHDPLVIFRTWEGGLASHGGILGVFIGGVLFYLKHKKEISFLALVDILCIPTMFVCSLIRIGNFFNQEICGKVTDVPWAVVFLHPADVTLLLPRHPVQLYESAFYFFVFLSALFFHKKFGDRWQEGRIVGYCFLVSFTFRFFIEGLKDELSHLLEGDHLLLMGQYLSLPMIALGALLFFGNRFSRDSYSKSL